MERLIFTAPERSIPDISSEAYRLLIILADGAEHPRDELCRELSGGFRASLQQLMGEYYDHWLIESEIKEFVGLKQAHYQLNERHLSCDCEQDKDARTIARKRYKDRSHQQAKGGLKRYKKAAAEKEKADREFCERFDEVVSDE